MDKQDMLTKLKAARALLAEHWIPWKTSDSKGGHCHLGCVGIAFGGAYQDWIDFPAVRYILDAAAKRLHPELIGEQRRREGCHGLMDHFHLTPAVFVNNHLGKDAILAVYDDVISALEVAVLYEEETAKHAARAGLQDAVEIERYAASLRVDSHGG